MESLIADFLEYLLKNKHVPKWVSLLLYSLLMAFLFLVFLLGGFQALKATGVIGAIVCWAFVVPTLWAWAYLVCKVIQFDKGNERSLQSDSKITHTLPGKESTDA